ncbi:MAG: tyrosine-protein phosphatase [Caldilineaceae bacterium]
MPTRDRELIFPHLLNIRDLGGCRTRDGQETRWRSLLRADDLCRLTPGGEQYLFDYGVRTVIDLRWPVDGKTHPNFLHEETGPMAHHAISLLGDSIDAWRAIPARSKEQFNCLVLEHFQGELRTVLQVIADAPPGGVLFHCVSGKDRTGVIAALLQTLVDVEVETIIVDYGLSTKNLREPYLAAYPTQPDAVLERVRCPPEQIHNMLAYLADHYGNATRYLDAIGLSNAEIIRLKERLLTG